MATATELSRHQLAYPDAFLSSAPLPLETGIQRMPGGELLVACRTDMDGCKGPMLDWWFKYFDTSEHLRWWHPSEHKEQIGWDDKRIRGRSYIGATTRAVQGLGAIPPAPAVLKFHDPREFFSGDAVDRACAKGDVSAIVCATIGLGEHSRLDPDGDPLDGLMVHVMRDTTYGAVLRSRFLLGLDSAHTGRPVPDFVGLGLMQHCYCEYTYLSRVLPSLYYGDPKNGEAPVLW